MLWWNLLSNETDASYSGKVTVAGSDTPISINKGNSAYAKGFLDTDDIEWAKEAIDYLLKGSFKIENRLMLSALNGKMEALNDIVIKGEAFSRTSRFIV